MTSIASCVLRSRSIGAVSDGGGRREEEGVLVVVVHGEDLRPASNQLRPERKSESEHGPDPTH